jgi:hypothetical protein
MMKKTSKMYAAGGKMKAKGAARGGKMQMVETKDGKKVPFFAADGKGKMMAGGMVPQDQRVILKAEKLWPPKWPPKVGSEAAEARHGH